jgi:hypothetical protein
MVSIKDSVESLLNKDIEGKNALARGILNMSQYARTIQAEVARESKKNVSVQSIVVTLARLERKLKAYNYLPNVPIRNISVKSPIVQIVFEKNSATLDSLIESIKKTKKLEDAFFSFSTSSRDIALVMSAELEGGIMKEFSEKPKLIKRNLSAVSIRFDEELVEESNVGLSLLHKTSLRNIVIDAAVTTYNEFTIVFEMRFLHDAIEVLSPEPKK